MPSRIQRLNALLREATAFVEESVGDTYNVKPRRVREYGSNSDIIKRFGVTMPGEWICDGATQTVHAPASSFTPDFGKYGRPDVNDYFDTYLLALEVGQMFFIQKSAARRKIYEEADAHGIRTGYTTENAEDALEVLQYFTAPIPDILALPHLNLLRDGYVALGLSEGFGHLTGRAFTQRTLGYVHDEIFGIRTFPISKVQVEQAPTPEVKANITIERLGTLYAAHMLSQYEDMDSPQNYVFRHFVGIKREELQGIGTFMRQLYISSP